MPCSINGNICFYEQVKAGNFAKSLDDLMEQNMKHLTIDFL